MAFSRRTVLSFDHAPNPLGEALARRRAARGAILDLTVSNPTSTGLPYDAEAIGRALASPRALVYEPEPLGLPSARATVAAACSTPDLPISPSRVALTASTSEAYAVLFKMLCDPGDEVLAPVPSYPLLGWLTSFEGVVLRTYPLEYAGGWHIDVDALSRAITPRTRAIVVVNPNNPTGSFLGKDELEAMLDLGVPIVCDEVFARYPLVDPFPSSRIDTALRATRGLVFSLSGLSKLVGLPQMKLGWIVAGGDRARVEEAMARLELVLDAYLSVGAPVQHALPELLRVGAETTRAIAERTRTNLSVVRALAGPATPISALDLEGGWYATLRVPETKTDEQWALALLDEDGIYVHPGYFFDMARGAHLVVSLLTPEIELRRGLERIVDRVTRDA